MTENAEPFAGRKVGLVRLAQAVAEDFNATLNWIGRKRHNQFDTVEGETI
jgi:hypothetical protein